jgi:hypothetical protein
MNIYLDDDSAEALLVRLLAREGHDAQLPADVLMSGENDPVHCGTRSARGACYCREIMTTLRNCTSWSSLPAVSIRVYLWSGKTTIHDVT